VRVTVIGKLDMGFSQNARGIHDGYRETQPCHPSLQKTGSLKLGTDIVSQSIAVKLGGKVLKDVS
jgi:hypothetical protein